MSALGLAWLFGPQKQQLEQEPAHTQSYEVDEQTPEETLNALLEQFKTSSLPPTSRFAGELDPQRESQPISVLGLWRHAFFLAGKAKDLAADVASYHLHGPRRPSWGIEMTMLASFMRGLADHTHLTDVPTLRAAMAIGGLIPTPSDALITPVTFRVERRNLRGILAEYDRLEKGAREISGEWVVSKRLWQRLQYEWKGAQNASRAGPRIVQPKVKERVVLFLHGGAYYTASAATHRLITINLSKHIDARVFAINYRLAPDTRFPGPIHDAASAYFRLTEDLKIPPGNIIIAGDSAGAGLSVALMMYLRDEGYPLPGAAILMCPWVDLTMSCASWDTNADLDIITFPTDPADHMNPVACYLGPTRMKELMTHPYASPLFGNFVGLPPMLIQAGDCEVLRDEVTLLAHKATLAGVQVTHEIYEDAVHVFQLYPFLDQSRKAFRSCRSFVFNTLPAIHRKQTKAQAAELGVPSPMTSEGGLDEQIEVELEKEILGSRTATVVDGLGKTEALSVAKERVFPSDVADKDDDSESDLGVASGNVHIRKYGTVQETITNELPTQDVDVPLPARSQTPPSSIEPKTERPPLWRTFASKSSSHISTLSTHASIAVVPQPPLPTDGKDSDGYQASRSPPRSRSSTSSALPSPTSPRRFTSKPISRIAPLVPSSNLSPPIPEVRTRARTHSHPDMVHLMKQYAQSGPANRTTTYQHLLSPS